ncbi:hypothetical protein FWF89_03470 [Candidatus Saccharibacteria bacterium]|nr:hypothetical protein [Candidatus Saccharibacteria bacterium]
MSYADMKVYCEQNGLAYVEEVDGEIVLHDPQAMALFRAFAKDQCRRKIIEFQSDRIDHFKNRAATLGQGPKAVVIGIFNVDDEYGGLIANQLMPGFNWQEIRDKGETPYARGLVDYGWIADVLEKLDKESHQALIDSKELCVVVVDDTIALVFPA